MRHLSLALALLLANACAVSVEGDVEGDPLPAFLSSAWTSNGDGNAISLLLASHLDVCGVSVRRTQQSAEGIDALVNDSSDVPTAAEVGGVMEEVDQRTAPGDDYWTIAFAFAVDDLAHVENQDFDGTRGFLFGSVCHQQGPPAYDADGIDGNRSCSFSDNPEIRVGAFAEQGELAFEGDTDLLDGDGDAQGSLKLRASAAPCPALEKANQDFSDALAAWQDAR